MISNDEDLGFFLDEISISVQHRTPLCMLIVERTIPCVPNPTQDSHIPFFVPEMIEGEKIHGLKVVPSQPAYEEPINDDPPLNDDSRV